MVAGSKISWTYILSFAYIASLGISLFFENYLLLALPFVLFLILGAIFHIDKLLLFITFCVPLSINLEEFNVEAIGLFIPTEPVLAAFSVLFVLREFHKGSLSKEFYNHPITKCIFFYLLWMGITCLTSTKPLVSFKFLISRLWFIIPCYFGGVLILNNWKNYRKFLFIYSLPLVLVVLYTIYSHFILGFTEKAAHWVMSPFFKDHTSYGAAIAMFIPIVIGMLFLKGKSTYSKMFWIFALFVLLAGVILSYTRAAWLSLIGAFILFVILYFKINFKYLLLLAIPIGVYLANNYSEIFVDLQRNKTDSSDDLAEHVQSMSNISSDASNLERINRWKCAIAMFNERPITGWGPGTYAFEYGPFQERRDLTFISKFDGTGGNAHSDYLGALSESGLLGSISFIMIIVVLNVISIRLILCLNKGNIKTLIFSSYLGLMTYVMHAFLNNFLDTDKIAVPFWGFTAFIVITDLYHKRKTKELAVGLKRD